MEKWMPTFKTFEEFAAYDWPKSRPVDCTNLDRAESDCFDNGTHEADYCSSCMEYQRRCEAWNFEANRPEAAWWRLINTQHKHNDITGEPIPDDSDDAGETDCVFVIGGYECASRTNRPREMCPGCKTYWRRVARMQGKTAAQCILEVR